MKSTSLVIFLLIGLMGNGIAQEKIDQKEMIGFACFFGGMPTDPVLKVTKKLYEKKYKTIAKMLQSKNNAERYMAAVTLEKLEESNKYTLSEKDKTEIEKIKQSSEVVSVCSGCSYFDVIELKKMFSTEMKLGTERWLDKHF
ncbi:hypothetical protein [uncultured Aquimarina sp.]|uniref:hypothetical protein n=1 Tax=uncultured Aquimarina sp. TaxID=575652 RepID=UPI0026026DE4|nr:hypothetical protein [uncultured Aquimarina sp.]